MNNNADKSISSRKHPTHGIKLVDGQPTVIFDTVCTKDRKRWLANNDVHSLLNEIWLEADTWLIGRYVIMPDHIHYFAWFTGSEIEYHHWVTYWKSQFSKRFRQAACRWQTDDWDRRLRSLVAYEEKWVYVRHNPVRHGLVEKPEDWPYQGELFELRWQ